MSIDNREAMAYLLFRRFGCSRDEALAAVDELSEMFAPVKKCAGKRWRVRRRRRIKQPEQEVTR